MKRKFYGVLMLGALAIASASLTSCKDYDDDINNLQTQVDQKADKTALEQAQATLQNAITALSTELKAEDTRLASLIAAKADQTDLTAAVGRIAALETRLATAESTLTSLRTLINDLDTKKVEKSVYEAAVTDIYAKLVTVDTNLGKALESISQLSKGIENEETARKAADANLQQQIEALNAYKARVEAIEADYLKAADKTELLNKITTVSNELATVKSQVETNKNDIATLKDQMQKLSDKVDQLTANVNVLTVLVNRILNSISLVPQLYVNGIEAIEFRSLAYKEAVKGTSGLQTTGSQILIDNGTAEAYYRLNPAIVERSSIDEDGIDYLAAISATRAITPTTTSPVKFNGIAAWDYNGQKGLVKVNLKKTTTGSLNRTNGEIYIVALKVPRKADAQKNVEAADIVSENSRLVETTFTPRIARLTWNLTESLRDNTGAQSNIHHYSDSAVVWKSNVDATPLEMVYAEVEYNKTLNVRDIVTGCYDRDNSHNQITKDELAAYGLEFRFAIPTTPYKMDVDHSTDQQQFATIDAKTGIVSSKLPNGVVDNRACVGKEPIIRIMLIDVNNNKLVDERYMKIKWIEKQKAPVDLGKFTSETELIPCEDNIATPITWQWFINQVYAKADGNGLSQSVFETVYPAATYVYSTVTMNPANSTPDPVLAAIGTPAKPVVAQTTNEQGDALIATWSLTPQEIARIYPSQSKTFTCQITFKSALPTEYPDLTLTWEWVIKLPKLPEINGHYDNYWYTKYELHDVMPVQYNTQLYKDIASGTISAVNPQGAPQGGTLETYNANNNLVAPGTPYCVYYNNLMNAFTYEEVAGVPRFIVKGLPSCGTWDMQFTKADDDQFKGALNNNKTYTQYTGYTPNFTGKSPLLNPGTLWNVDGAYRLCKDVPTYPQALQLVWTTVTAGVQDDSHVAWCGNPTHQNAILYADHNNPTNQVLINPLADTNESDGRTPQRTHDKKVHMGVWATLNDWNVIPVKDYDICLVAPLRIDAKLDGAFEEGYISGTAVDCSKAFTMTDFRGYTVAKTNGTGEWKKYATALWNYYEVSDPEWKLSDVKYGMKKSGSNVVADDNLTYSNAMTSAQIESATNGNIVLSVEMWRGTNGIDYLVFRNNGGSNVEEEVNIFIPATVKYGFGSVTQNCKVRLYPKGKVATGVDIIPYEFGGTKIN